MNNLVVDCLLCNTRHQLFGTCRGQVLPSWRRPTMPVTGPWRSRMHQDLADFLDLVWNRRGEPNFNHNRIYEMYNEAPANPIADPRMPAYLAYLEALEKIARDNECRVAVQDYENFTFPDLLNQAKNHANAQHATPDRLLRHARALAGAPNMSRARARMWLANDLTATFYHFLPYKRGACAQRVYLNVGGDHATKVMGFVVNAIVCGIRGMSEAKVAGPRGAGERSDTIVIYSPDALHSAMTIERLTEYQRLPGVRDRFGDEVPKMTQRVDKLRGVGVGAEPDAQSIEVQRSTVVTTRESFGTMRSKLIGSALAAAGGDKDRFFLGVIRNFLTHGLSPMAPHV